MTETSIAPEPAPLPPDPADEQLDDLAEAEAETLELRKRALRDGLPEWLDVDDDLNIVPAEGFIRCPLCAGDGVTRPEFAQDPTTMTCPDCRGQGQVSTGSILKETMIRSCPSCSGNGFVDRASWEAIHPPERNDNLY